MKRCLEKLISLSLVGMLSLSMVFTSYAYDSQYPLKGRIEENFVLIPSYTDPACTPESRFYESTWKWDIFNIGNEVMWDEVKAGEAAFWAAQEERKAAGTGYVDSYYDYNMDCAIRDRNPDYLTSYRGVEMAVLADLAGYPLTRYDYVDVTEREQLGQAVRDFLNSYSDWDTASDFEKVTRICERITRADYDDDVDRKGNNFAYSCLVEGKTVCGGYTAAAELLSTCVGISTSIMGGLNHAFPVFLVDGVWLRYEPTTKDASLWIAEVYEPVFVMNGVPQMFQIGKYCEGTGYTVPTDISDKFAPIGSGVRKGESAQFVRFLNPNNAQYEYMRAHWEGYLKYENPKGVAVPRSPFQ